MKKNNLDDFINQLKPLSEQETNKQIARRNLPVHVKKPKNNSGKYFRYIVGSILGIFLIIFIVNIVQSSRRTLDEQYQNAEIVKKPEQNKNVVAVKQTAKSKPVQVAKAIPLPAPVETQRPLVVATPPAQAPKSVEVKKPVVAAKPVQPKPVAIPVKQVPVIAAKPVATAKPIAKAPGRS